MKDLGKAPGPTKVVQAWGLEFRVGVWGLGFRV